MSRLRWWSTCPGPRSAIAFSSRASAGRGTTLSRSSPCSAPRSRPIAFSGSPREERIDPAAHALIDAPAEARSQIGRIRVDTYLGMAFSNLVSLFIIITTAATLHAHGITDIQTSAQAAEALRPIAGIFTFALFAA